jgi:type II secretory pathway component PulK
MRIRRRQRPSEGIALIIVLLVIAILAVLAGNFAATMKVETLLARNTNFDSEYEWLARGGVNSARAVLAAETANFTALNQKWANGMGGTNGPYADLDMHHIQVGDQFVEVEIIDQERFFNINTLKRMIDSGAKARAAQILDNVLSSGVGVDAGAVIMVRDSIIDWLDADDNTEASGAETSDYKSRSWLPHIAKNGPLDDLSELLLVHGITEQPQIYSHAYANPMASLITKNNRLNASAFEQVVYPTTLIELFTTLSSGQININTADAKVLQVIPEMIEPWATAIVGGRAGPDQLPNTDDDGYRSVNLSGVPQVGAMIPPEAMATLAQYFTVQSFYFKVNVKIQLAGGARTYHAILQRKSPRDIQMLAMDWD